MDGRKNMWPFKKKGGLTEKPEGRVTVEHTLGRLEAGGVKIRDFRSVCEGAVDNNITTTEAMRLQKIINGKGFLHPSMPVIVWFD